jgi:hypothetical protein
MSYQYYTRNEKKEKSVGDSPLIHHGHCPITKKKLTKIVLTPLQKDA